MTFSRNEIKEWDDARLVEEYKDLWETIYRIECFGSRDLIMLSWLEDELYRRGYRAVGNIEIYKLEDEAGT